MLVFTLRLIRRDYETIPTYISALNADRVELQHFGRARWIQMQAAVRRYCEFRLA